jgi:hypothetical protein
MFSWLLDVSKPVAPAGQALWPGRSVVHCATIDHRRPVQRKSGDRLAPGRQNMENVGWPGNRRPGSKEQAA